MRIDLHCHSKYSKRPSLWIMQKLGCPESFTEPEALYRIARSRGMTAVTITDHNVIDGCLEIVEFPNTFISCEYTTYFPEDQCKIHVVAYDISEPEHRDLSEARENIYDLVAYLEGKEIPHACAHPLYSVNDRLSEEHVEKLVLLFKYWEWNGDRGPAINAALYDVANSLSPALVGQLVDKHGIVPDFQEPWIKRFTGGSDDHSSLNLAKVYTEVPGAENLEAFWSGVENGAARVHWDPATPRSLARSIYGIAYQFYKTKLGLERHVNRDVFLRFLDRALQTRDEYLAEPWVARFQLFLGGRRRGRMRNAPSGLFELCRREAEQHIRANPQLMAILQDGANHPVDMDDKWFDFVNAVADRVLVHSGRQVLDRVLNARLLGMFNALGAAGALYTMLAPYFVSFSLYAKERVFGERVRNHFLDGRRRGDPDQPQLRIAHFTDTFDEVNGVAKTLRQGLATAQALNEDYTIVTCTEERGPFQRGVHQFLSVGAVQLPEYPELRLLCPPFLQMLNHCYEEGFTSLHVATPGPVGLAGLGIARILKLPVSGTYHTSLPQYAGVLTDDSYVEDLAWRYMAWFYSQLDAVYVPSSATREELEAKGVPRDRIRVYPRGVDTERFHPEKRSSYFQERYSFEQGAVVLLYVGRVSREKDLDVLSRAYQELCRSAVRARLVITGDGPYRREMEAALSTVPALFTGYVEGEELARLYASSDVFVFPSSTDTFGNVVLEAQASGIPVIVSNAGGPRENLIPGETGLVVPAGDHQALCAAMRDLVSNEERRRDMGRAARAYAEQRSFREAFRQLYAMYAQEETRGQATANPLIEALAFRRAAAAPLSGLRL
jgi:glycosyltransferase involved in cell wall biosynthesis